MAVNQGYSIGHSVVQPQEEPRCARGSCDRDLELGWVSVGFGGMDVGGAPDSDFFHGTASALSPPPEDVPSCASLTERIANPGTFSNTDPDRFRSTKP